MRIAILLGGLLLSFVASVVYGDVSPDMQRAIRENTFEVVMKKPERDPVSYEKPLPLDLLPFIERNDAYRSVGTAFALGNNTYVTAGHVFLAGINSQFGPPALRRSDGTVFEVDHILKFSVYEDFVVFSLRKDPAPAGLTANRNPKLDEPVLAVGNALGEGIVIRDGLFTSETPEAQDGRWKWLRFSAAASPGNSGGPLCDGDGKVMGIVIGKSPNENLNYSLPISRVLDGEPMKARFDQKALASYPYMQGTVTYAYKDEFNLPLAWPDFAQAFQKVTQRHYEEASRKLLSTYADTLFPRGPGSQDLLFDADTKDARPRLIIQQADGTWTAETPAYHRIELPQDGSLSFADEAGARLLSLVRSAAATDDAFYSDSKAFMDLALKGLDLRRPVGADKVRVISLGPAKSDALYTDPYGRKWQERVWAVPFVDVYLVGELLPTPDGYAAIIEMSPSLTLPEVLGTARLLAGQLDVSYSGSLTQWRAALNRRSLLPAALSEVKLEATPMWTLKTPRFVSAVPPDVLALTDKSPMMLTMGFMSQGSQTASWDIQGVLWDQDDRKDAAVQLQRYVRPPDSAKAELRNRFDSIWQRRSPYDATLSREAVDTYAVSSVLDVPGRKASTVSADLEYGLTVYLVEHPSSAKAAAAMARTTDVTHVLEHSVGEDVTRESRSSLTSGTAPSGAIPSRSVPSGATASAVMMDEFERTELGVAAGLDKELGKDPRGRVMSDDLRAWMAALRTEKPVNASETETAAWWREQMANFVYFQTYWKQVPALVHNRDMFAVFLERNYLPVNRPHEAAVIEAERALLASLSTEHPSPEWPLRENQLRAAYVQERSALIKTLFAKWSTATPLHPRTSACPPPETTTSGTPHPAIGSNTRSLESLWPLESRQLGEEGTVMASLRISATGCVTAMNIVGSSGSDLMDQAVLKFLESQSFKPAAADGRPVESSAMLPIVFKLQN